MTETCCTEGNDVMILACSGGSNVGQLSNQKTRTSISNRRILIALKRR